ncbi:MAG TPA: peptidoglycan DD-metalloendopeptidase family protein, partial [Acidimicrobiales bacterium]|nr:peptidoglycan DD-metalloendopeptidase family protein [Acidimicrobiales bacterium]
KPNVKARAKRRLQRNLRGQLRDQLRGGNDNNKNKDPNLLQGDGIANAAGRLAKQTPRKALRFAKKRIKRLLLTKDGEKALEKTRKSRKLVRRLILVQLLTIVLTVVGSLLFILFAIAGEPDPEMIEQQAVAQAGGMVAIPDALIPQVAEATGIPVEALKAYSSAAARYFVPLVTGNEDQDGPPAPGPTPNPAPGPSPVPPGTPAGPRAGIANWALLAGIGEAECNHGQSRLPGCSPKGTINVAGARGPMQFLGSTWRGSAGTYDLDVAGAAIAEGQEGQGYASDGDGDGVADPWTFEDATHGAARLLLRNGLRDGDSRSAIHAYNRSWTYVDMVLANAQRYMDAVASLGLTGSGQVVGGYALPLDMTWYTQHKDWFTKPHHDYPAADIPVPTGTPVYAAAPGTVASAPTSGKCGTGVTVNGDDGAYYIYCHGSDGGVLISPGERVDAGQLIMHSASTGNSTGPHLHFGIQINGQDRCPQQFFVGIAESRPVSPQSLAASGCSY